MEKPALHDRIFEISETGFEAVAMEIFHQQYARNKVYKTYVDALGRDPSTIRTIAGIPFLPIEFFKSQQVLTGDGEAELLFTSSGTTATVPSRHFVKEAMLYENSFLRGFRLFYGDPGEYCILGLLPSYLERENSSLVYMVDKLIQASNHPDSGFYLHDFMKLAETLKDLEQRQQKTVLIGVSFALLDFAAAHPVPLKHTIVMETGGMKGRRKEMIRAELHEHLCKAFQIPLIHSEFGMTELLSQAYSKGDGIFRSPSWMRILLRDEEDPLSILPAGRISRGAINIIDLANIHSCSFIASDDAGKAYPDGSFEVLGRLDNSDLRGCSLLVDGLGRS